MWARNFELMLALWLGNSWIIFGYGSEQRLLMWHDFTGFLIIGLLSLLSYFEKLRHLHLGNFLVGA